MKKFQSAIDKSVYFMEWKCELGKQKHIEFCGLVELVSIHFIFIADAASFVLTIPRSSPFRLVDETYLGALGEHLNRNKSPKLPGTNTWKFWGTPFLKELDYATLLFFDRPEEERFQYLVLTQNECLEFVSSEANLERFEKKELDELFRMFCENELKALRKLQK